MTDLQQFYSKRIQELRQEEANLNALARKISLARLGCILAAAGFGYAAYAFGSWYLAGTAILFSAFLYLVKKHVSTLDELAVLQRIMSINEGELKLLNGDKSVFDHGGDIQVPQQSYALDLDIFGTGSLFQSINRTATLEGRALVSDALLQPLADKSAIEKRVAAATEIVDEVAWRQRFMALGQLSEEKSNDLRDLRSWLEIAPFFEHHGNLLFLARLGTGLSVLVIGAMIILGRFEFFWLIGLLTLNTAFIQFHSKATKTYFRHFGERTALFNKFAGLFALISDRNFNSAISKDIHHQVAEASAAFKALSKVASAAEQRLNGLAGPLMNGLFLFDAWSIRRIERWRLQHKPHVDGWMRGLSEMDMLISFANFRFNHPHFCDAQIVEGGSIIEAEALAHPMMPQQIAVTNDYVIGATDKAHIITGSNMAGKSTFIRAVGLNMVLALNGLPVSAKKFTCSILTIATCIRITDSLEENASYFKAEITRLSQIMNAIESGKPFLVLLDEILRGTNSDDKRMGTLAFFRKVGSKNCLSLLATHDLHVGDLHRERPEVFSNYCFESSIDRSGLHFDYKLRQGVSRTTNATHLMRNMGLID